MTIPPYCVFIVYSIRVQSNQEQGHQHNGNRATRRPTILFSISFHSSGALTKAARLFIAPLHNQPMYPKMCYVDIFANLQLVG